MENWEQNYWAIYSAVVEVLASYHLIGTDKLINDCINRIRQDADEDWNEDDVRIAIRNALNELIEKM